MTISDAQVESHPLRSLKVPNSYVMHDGFPKIPRDLRKSITLTVARNSRIISYLDESLFLLYIHQLSYLSTKCVSWT